MRITTSKRRAFTLIELLIVIVIIAILASFLLVALSKAQEEGRRVRCISNQRNLILAFQGFIDDNNDSFPNTDYEGCNGNKLLWVSGYLNHFSCKTDSTNTLLLTEPKYAQLAEYLREARIYKCPSDRKRYTVTIDREDNESASRTTMISKARSYSLNWHLGWVKSQYGTQPLVVFNKINEVSSPSSILSFIDVNSDSICWSFFGITRDNIFMYPAIYHNGMANISFLDGHVISKKWKTREIIKPNPERQGFHGHAEPAKGNSDLNWLMTNSQE